MKKAFQIDLARQIERPDYIRAWLSRHAEWGYDQIYLYLEDAFDFPSFPGLGRKYAYSPKEMARLVRESERYGLKVVPIIPLLGHTEYLNKHEEWRQLSEIRGPGDNPLNSAQLCPLHERLPEMAERLIRDIRPFCTAGIVHLSLDESFDIGKCAKCRKEIEVIGLGQHFANYVTRMEALCRTLGLRLGLWADMLYYFPEAIPFLPKSVIAYDWFYYPFKKRPRIELHNFAEVDLTGKLKKAGIEVFGCPINSPFIHENMPPVRERLRNISDWWRYCHEKNADGIMISSWILKRSAPELSFLINAAAAGLWLEPDAEHDPASLYQAGMQRVYGVKNRKAGRVMLDAEKYQNAGYYRWQPDTKWAALASFESVRSFRKEEHHFQRLVSRAKECNAPPVITDTLIVREYIAKRQCFIQDGSRILATARETVRKGQKLHKEMETLQGKTMQMQEALRLAQEAFQRIRRISRYMRDVDILGDIQRKEGHKLKEFQAYIKQVVKKPKMVFEPSLLLSRWHLLFWVRNFAPALQGTAVEMQRSDGSWDCVHRVYSLEFTEESSQRRANLLRKHSVPLDWDGANPLYLHLAIRGIGQLAVYGAKVTDGVQCATLSLTGKAGGTIASCERLLQTRGPGAVLGNKAPDRGFPSIDWSENQAWLELVAVP